MTEYIKGFLTLLILLTILLYLPPGKSYQKYIHFFAELIMTIALLSPILSIFYDSEEFLDMVEYEAFMEELSAVSRDMDQIEFLHSDYHRDTYEEAIAMDVERIAEGYAFEVQDVTVALSEEYTVQEISIEIAEDTSGEIDVERSALQEANAERGAMIGARLKQELMEYYQLVESQVKIQYSAG